MKYQYHTRKTVEIKYLLILVILFTLQLISHAQPIIREQVAYSQFQVSIGGTGTDVAHSIVQTTDGGYALAGYTFSFGGGRAYIVKIDASGMIEWTKTFGGSVWPDDINSIIQTIDGGYIAAGTSIFKFDKNGTLEWCENISGESWSIIQTSDGGYAIAGSTNSFGAGGNDMFIVKLDSSGSLQWARTVGGTSSDQAYSIIQTTDSGYAVAGAIRFAGRPNVLIIKLNKFGTLEWAKSVGNEREIGYSIIQTSDFGYVVAGKSLAFDPSAHFPFYIVKLDSIGALQWTRTVSLRDYNIANSIIQTADDGYAVVGYTMYIEGFPDWLIVKLDSSGVLEWSRVVTGATEAGNEAFSIIKTIGGGCVVAGIKDSFEPAGDMYIVKYDSNWNTCGSNDSLVSCYSSILGTVTSVTPTVTSPTGFITPRAPVIGSGGTATMLCVTGIQPISSEVPVSFKLYQNYPNPFNPITKIKFSIPPSKGARPSRLGSDEGMITKLTIYDILGREVATLINQQLIPGTYEVEWDGSNYPSGVYFYKLETLDFSLTKKMVLMK